MRPLVGITTYLTQARWSYWNLEAALIPADYMRSVERAGGRPLLVPPATEAVEETLDALGAIVFTGGADMDPALYGEQPHPETSGIQRLRDDAELALLSGALERNMPVLAICRGIQVLNVGLGGDLYQHLPEVVGHEGHKHDPPGEFNEHEIVIEPETLLARVHGPVAHVMSHHHQGLRRLGAGLIETAHTEDGAVEAVEMLDKRFAVGVLWHPEAGSDLALFRALIEEAARYVEEQ